MVDTGKKGFIDARDIQQLAQAAGQSISMHQAQRIVDHSCSSPGELNYSDFHKMISPPEP